KQSDMYKLGLTPREAQLMVVQLGTQVLATMPAEITTTTGGRMKDAIAGALGLADSTRVSAVAVTNGYLNYVATADEYKEQYYEGSSTLFGPNSAEAFKNILVAMAKQLPAANEASPAPLVGKAKVWRDPPPVHRFASAREGPETVARCFTRPNMIGNTMVFRFRDWYPGRLLRAAYPLLQVETRGSGDWRPLTWDDDPQLEIRAIRKDGRRGHWWEVRWTPDQLPAQWRVLLTRRGENGAIYSDDARAICPLT
ncbi:MAG TPA: neutral/alkaline non-lysosomal ceramidase N-terminal domain-containing protein, partial [Longimicrobiales bacterium]